MARPLPTRRIAALVVVVGAAVLVGWWVRGRSGSVTPPTSQDAEVSAPAPAAASTARPPGTLGSSLPAPAPAAAIPASGTLRVVVLEGGRPRSAIRVSVRPTRSFQDSGSQRTGPDGLVRFDLPHDLYYVAVDEPGLASQVRTVEHARPLTDVALALHPAGEIQGTVRDTRGQPLAGATVQFDPERQTGGVASCDAQGRFRLRLEPGQYALKIDAAGRAGEWRRGLQVVAGEVRTEDFELGGLEGSLRVAARCGDRPCEGAEVVVVWTTGAESGVTDAAGVTTVEGLPGVRVEVTAVWAAGELHERRATRPVQLAEGQRADLRMDLEPVR